MALVFPSDVSDGRYVVGGVGKMYIGPYTANGADAASLAFLGGTIGGIEVDQKRDLHLIDLDEWLSPAAAFPAKEEFGFKATFAETYLANLQNFLFNFGNALTGGGRGTGPTGSLTLGEDKTRNYRQLVYRGPATPNYGAAVQRYYQFWQCVPVAIGPTKYEKGKEATIAVTFRALADPTAFLAGANPLGKVFEQ